MTHPLLLLATATALLFVGCSGSKKVRGIAVELVDVQSQTVAGGGTEVTAQIRYMNENLVPIAAAGARHRLSLNGASIGRIDSKQPIGLPQMSNETNRYVLELEAGALTRLRELQALGSATYQLDTTVLIHAGNEKLESRTTGSGTVDLSNLQL